MPDPSNPQSLNRYGLRIQQSALKFVDPSGNSAEWYGESWKKEFYKDHGRDPNFADYVYRRDSMEAVSRGDDWSVQHWVETKHNRLARQFFSMAKQGGWFHHLSGADQAAIQFNIPEGVDLAENIRISEWWGFDFVANPDAAREVTGSHAIGFTFAVRHSTKFASWFNRIRPYGKWDYKRRLDDHEVYQDFGNFNFGVTGAAEGISEEDLLRGAGAEQSVMDRFLGRPGPANPTGYGDHPRDEAMIRLGYAFYTAMQRAQ